jgi:hypothetical protein
VHWNRNVKDRLLEEERIFLTEMDNMTVWVIEDAVAFALLYPEDY